MDNQVIDQVNIYEATKLAMKEAISQRPSTRTPLIDAMKLDLPISQTSIIKGDAIPYPLQLHPSLLRLPETKSWQTMIRNFQVMIFLKMLVMERLNI